MLKIECPDPAARAWAEGMAQRDPTALAALARTGRVSQELARVSAAAKDRVRELTDPRNPWGLWASEGVSVTGGNSDPERMARLAPQVAAQALEQVLAEARAGLIG